VTHVIQVEASITIDQPISEVFAFLADQHHVPQWQPSFVAVHQLTPLPIGVGTKYIAIRALMDDHQEVFMEYAAFSQEQEITIIGQEDGSEFRTTYLFEAAPRCTKIFQRLWREPDEFTLLSDDELAASLMADLTANFHALKTLLENRTALLSSSFPYLSHDRNHNEGVTMMPVEANKALRQQWLDYINAKDIDAAIELLHPEFVSHAPGRDDIEGVRQWFNMLFTAFPDMNSTTQVLFTDGDKAVHSIRVEGTHTGTFMGIPSTGKRASWTLIDIVRFADGKMIEHWNETDTLGMMQQLGLGPGQPA
jgi:steroid delta-isomerase-like uncharacterized protein